VTEPATPHRFSRDWQPEPTVITLANGTRIGGREVVVIAGPCAVESEDQIMTAARLVREAGATILRGGAFKARTSPYAFQGLGLPALRLLARAAEEAGLAVVTEALGTDTIDAVAEHADIVQIGARNMQNYPLLRRAGRAGRPVLLKRGPAATIDEWLMAAEYVMSEGNGDVILCERGIRSFDGHSRNLLDLTAIPVVHARSHLPIIADPSHGTGVRANVAPMAAAALAAGADGIMVEVHPAPDLALSDSGQSLGPDDFAALMGRLEPLALATGRALHPPPVRA
jgi:3-deoxy-7-phosphoheptulonate synthase